MSSRGFYFFLMLHHTEVKYTLSEIYTFFLLGNHIKIYIHLLQKKVNVTTFQESKKKALYS